MESRKPHVAIFPSAGMSHLIPFVKLAKRLSAHHGIVVTFITCKGMFSDSRLQEAFSERMASLRGLDIHFLELPHVEMEEEEEAVQLTKVKETVMSNLVEKSKGLIESSLTSLQNEYDSASPVSAFITDNCLATFAVTDKLQLQIPTYLFFPSTASSLCLMLYLPKLVSGIQVSFKDVDFNIQILGLMPIPARDLPSPVQDRSDDAFH